MNNSRNKLYFKHFYMGDEDVDRYYCTIHDNNQNVAGWCTYYKPSLEYESVSIEYIEIYTNHQRNGYATLMVKELQTKYKKLVWNNQFTNVGRLWHESLIKKDIVLI